MQCASAPSRLTISPTRGRTTVKESSQIHLGMPFLSFERERVSGSLVSAFDDKPSGDPSGLQSRAQSFYGSLSAVGRREKLWDNGIFVPEIVNLVPRVHRLFGQRGVAW